MKTTMGIAAILAAVLAVQTARATDVFNLGGTRDPNTGQWTGVASLETVPVGDPGNAADARYTSPGYGAVAYTYNIGKYEVTAGQYCEFLNKVATTDTYGLYNTNIWSSVYGCKIQRSGASGSYAYTVASDYANRPVDYVSFWDACRFANWLSNGQPTGVQGPLTTERGTYTLDGYNGIDGRNIQRNPGATWAVTSADEWYKAAYYKGGGANAGYWDYATRSNTAPGQDMTDASGNNANWCTAPNIYPIDNGKYTTVVGEFQNSSSPYGTSDQGGNVREWNEAVLYPAYRGIWGGSFYPHAADDRPLWAGEGRLYYGPASENADIGFRVSEIPEPVSMALLAVGGLALLRRRAYCPSNARQHAVGLETLESRLMLSVTAQITPVDPDPRNTAVPAITIVFSEAVTGVDLGDFTLTRDGGELLLTSTQEVTTSDHITWTLVKLEGLTGRTGTYVLTLKADQSGITGQLSSDPLSGDASDTWDVEDLAPPTVGSPVINKGSSQRSTIKLLEHTFSEGVTGPDETGV